ncbi:MAG: hypothetical protein ABSD89_13610 [Halobacteriota archaeon]|jgi:hypothetical protein
MPVPATNRGPKPADFPLGSLESRAAARAMAKTRAGRDAKEPPFYRAHFDENGHPLEPQVIYDYMTGLPVSEATTDKPTPPEPLTICPGESETPRSAATVGLQPPGPLPAPGESIDETPIEPEANARIITVEIE